MLLGIMTISGFAGVESCDGIASSLIITHNNTNRNIYCLNVSNLTRIPTLNQEKLIAMDLSPNKALPSPITISSWNHKDLASKIHSRSKIMTTTFSQSICSLCVKRSLL